MIEIHKDVFVTPEELEAQRTRMESEEAAKNNKDIDSPSQEEEWRIAAIIRRNNIQNTVCSSD